MTDWRLIAEVATACPDGGRWRIEATSSGLAGFVGELRFPLDDDEQRLAFVRRAWFEQPGYQLVDELLTLRRQVQEVRNDHAALRWAWVVADELGAVMPGGVSYTLEMNLDGEWKASVSVRRSAYDVVSLELGSGDHLAAAMRRCEEDWATLRQHDRFAGMPAAKDPSEVEAERQRERELAGLEKPKRTKAPRKGKGADQVEPSHNSATEPGFGFAFDRAPIAAVDGEPVAVVEVAVDVEEPGA